MTCPSRVTRSNTATVVSDRGGCIIEAVVSITAIIHDLGQFDSVTYQGCELEAWSNICGSYTCMPRNNWQRTSLAYATVYFRVRAALFDHTVWGALPLPTPQIRALETAAQGYARDRGSRAAIDNPKDMRQLRQTHSRRSARVVTRPESQAAPPHDSIFQDDYLPAMTRLTGGGSRQC